MALSLRSNSDRSPVGLDIDGGFLAAVQTDGRRIVKAATMELPAGLITEGEVTDKDRLAGALKDFFKSNGLPKGVYVGIANQQIVVRQVELPRIDDDKEREAAVRFQAAEAIAMPLDEAVLDHQVIGLAKSEDGVERMQIVVVAARRTMVSELIDAAKAAGLKPAGLDLDAFALIRALGSDDGAQGVARVYCHLAGVTNLAIAVGSTCLFTRALSAPWADENAEGVAATLADEIRLSIDYYMAQPDAREVAEVILSGPGSQQEPLVRALDERMGRPTRVAAALPGFEASAVNAGEDLHRYTVAAGLSLGANA
jgi:type IV pilus assembly protein PilM